MLSFAPETAVVNLLRLGLMAFYTVKEKGKKRNKKEERREKEREFGIMKGLC